MVFRPGLYRLGLLLRSLISVLRFMSLCSLAEKVIPATAIKPFDIYGIVSIRYRSKLVDQVAIVKW